MGRSQPARPGSQRTGQLPPGGAGGCGAALFGSCEVPGRSVGEERRPEEKKASG